MIARLFLLVICMSLSPINARAQEYTYTFDSGYEEWRGDFADYPLTDSVMMNLSFSRERLPLPLDTNRYALRISGVNRSDDLFMFLKRKITGLLPSTLYTMQVDLELASKAPTNAPGVGGPPGEAVTIKAGATTIEPMKIIEGNMYRVNIDKSNQRNPGKDMDTLGNVGVTDTTKQYTIITRSNEGHPFKVRTDSNGEVWVCVGTDSGFEGLTTLYYTSITLRFAGTSHREEESAEFPVEIQPNPICDHMIIRQRDTQQNTHYTIADMCGRTMLEGHTTFPETRINTSLLASGVYTIVLNNTTAQMFVVGMR